MKLRIRIWRQISSSCLPFPRKASSICLQPSNQPSFLNVSKIYSWSNSHCNCIHNLFVRIALLFSFLHLLYQIYIRWLVRLVCLSNCSCDFQILVKSTYFTARPHTSKDIWRKVTFSKCTCSILIILCLLPAFFAYIMSSKVCFIPLTTRRSFTLSTCFWRILKSWRSCKMFLFVQVNFYDGCHLFSSSITGLTFLTVLHILLRPGSRVGFWDIFFRFLILFSTKVIVSLFLYVKAF